MIVIIGLIYDVQQLTVHLFSKEHIIGRNSIIYYYSLIYYKSGVVTT